MGCGRIIATATATVVTIRDKELGLAAARGPGGAGREAPSGTERLKASGGKVAGALAYITAARSLRASFQPINDSDGLGIGMALARFIRPESLLSFTDTAMLSEEYVQGLSPPRATLPGTDEFIPTSAPSNPLSVIHSPSKNPTSMAMNPPIPILPLLLRALLW
jgi:hypothetical protein